MSTPSTPPGAGKADGVVPRLAEALFSSAAERRGQARVPGEPEGYSGYSRGHSDYSGYSHGVLWVLPLGLSSASVVGAKAQGCTSVRARMAFARLFGGPRMACDARRLSKCEYSQYLTKCEYSEYPGTTPGSA